MDAVLLHCLRHVGEAAASIKRNNELAKSDSPPEELPRDQGFTRAKVRMNLPCSSPQVYAQRRSTHLTTRTCMCIAAYLADKSWAI